MIDTVSVHSIVGLFLPTEWSNASLQRFDVIIIRGLFGEHWVNEPYFYLYYFEELSKPVNFFSIL